MRTKIFTVLLLLFIGTFSSNAQVQNVIVETYYVSNDSDATDLDGAGGLTGFNLPTGSKTYRVYIDLVPGSRLIAIYGDTLHALKIQSTAPFFNNRDRGTRFGKDIDNTKLKKNSVALDTWLTLGKATKKHHGILKEEDTNGTVLHPGNDGGSAGIAGGLLVNDAAEAGIPLTQQDGLMHDSLIADTTAVGQWSENGFTDLAGNDTTMFGRDSIRTEFISRDVFLRQNSGIAGVSASGNKVLVAQLTTHGDISFELNIEIIDASGNIVKYVSDGSVLLAGEQISPFLKYPTVCGCTDPRYIEYSPAFACSNNSLCQTLIVFGCTDVTACNFNPDANFNVPQLCCYPGHCSDRDLATVCPELATKQLQLYPNPAKDEITLHFSEGSGEVTKYAVYDSFGKLFFEKNVSLGAGASRLHLDVSELPTGVYMLRIFRDDSSEGKMFLKN